MRHAGWLVRLAGPSDIGMARKVGDEMHIEQRFGSLEPLARPMPGGR
jgi:hypothetical protein